MPYLIDSDLVIDHLTQQQEITSLLENLANEGFAISIITFRETLRLQGKRVRTRALDLINASIALEHNLTLVTRNIVDYKDILNLKLLSP